MEENNNEKVTSEEVENKEVSEDKKEETKKPQNNNYMKFIMMAACILVVLYMMFGRGKTSDDSCIVVPQSPFGQSQAQQWVDLDTKEQNMYGCGFDLDLPTSLTDAYPNATYRVYTKQINEVTLYDSDNKKSFTIDKAIYCGKDLFESDDTNYNTVNKITVGDIEVVERGAMDAYTAISWVKGEYSYGLTCYQGGLSEEEVIELINGIE